MRQKGLRVEVNSTNPNIKDRINAVNALILNGEGERTLLVNTNKCPRLTETFEQQVYDDFGMPDKKSGLDHVGMLADILWLSGSQLSDQLQV